MFANKLFERRSIELSRQEISLLDLIGIDAGSFGSSDALKEATYFTCIKILAENIGKMPCHLMQRTEEGKRIAREHPLYDMVNLRPNEFMTAIDYQKAIETIRQHEGHSYALIVRKGNYVKSLYPFRPSRIVIDDKGIVNSNKSNKILIYYKDETGKEQSELYGNVLHFKGFSRDGYNFSSIRSSLKDTIETNIESQSYLKRLFTNGLTSKLLLQLTSDIKDDKELRKIQARFEKLASGTTNTGKILPVPAGYNVTPINLSLADAQFEQIKKMSIKQIAAAFGIKMHQLNDLQDTNNNSLEQQNLSFYVDTLLPLLTSIEQEMDWKLLTEGERKQGYYFRFNENVILRTDSKTQAEILTKYVAGAIKSPNEARLDLGYLKKEGGDDLIVNSGVFKLKDINELARLKGGDGNGGKREG